MKPKPDGSVDDEGDLDASGDVDDEENGSDKDADVESEHSWDADATRLEFDENVNVEDGNEVRDLAVEQAHR